MPRRAVRRPWVAANFALTWDGKISTRNRTPSDFSTKRDKRRLLEIRALADSVLVGAGTVAADGMTMGMPAADLRRERVARGQSPEPVRAIVSNSGRIDPKLRLFEKAGAPIVIFTTQRMPQRIRKSLEDKAELRFAEAEDVSLPEVLQTLQKVFGVERIDCEGGAQLFRSLVEQSLIDEFYLTLSPRIFGGEKAPTLTGAIGAFLPRSVSCSIEEMETIEGECYLRCLIRR